METHDKDTDNLQPLNEAFRAMFKARGWEWPDPEQIAEREAAIRAQRLTWGPEYADCFCLGEGGSGEKVGVVLEREPDGTVRAVAQIDGQVLERWERICPCPDGQRYLRWVADQRALAAEQLRQKRVQKLLGASGISKLASRDGWNVETWCRSAALAGATPATIAEVQATIATWREQIASDGTCLLLFVAGTWGVGKSGLAEALAAECATELRSALYRKAPEITNDLRLAYDRSTRHRSDDDDTGPGWDQLLRAYRETDLLVIDDLGTEAMTGVYEDRIREWLITIIDGRMGDLRPTVVTTNLTRAELATRYGERLADRLDSKYALRLWLDTPNLRTTRG